MKQICRVHTQTGSFHGIFYPAAFDASDKEKSPFSRRHTSMLCLLVKEVGDGGALRPVRL